MHKLQLKKVTVNLSQVFSLFLSLISLSIIFSKAQTKKKPVQQDHQINGINGG
jgi:hypothetical protein